MWTLLSATETERHTFRALDTALALPYELAAPRNRLREVRRLVTAHGVYFLKCFWRTQPKNQLRNALTAPRCRYDAEREFAVAGTLAAAGFGVARAVALGVRDGASFYLCAALAGRPLRELVARDELADRVARWLGSIAERAITLPDLSLDHVFVANDATLSVLDLHNGRARRPATRGFVRMLTHLARSARGLPVSRMRALRFAARLLRAGGAMRPRAILRRVPSLDTHSRYDAGDKSLQYGRRDPRRHARELAPLRRVWPGRHGDAVLDVPCGTGRLRLLLEGELGAAWLGADRAAAMLRLAAGPRVLADARALPFATGAVDGVVVFRFLHHLPEADARAVILEARRVARRWVLVSFFHPLAWNRLRRAARSMLLGRKTTRHSLAPKRLASWLREPGWSMRWARELPLVHELAVAVFRADG